MEDLLRTGRLPGELRSTAKITKVIPEKTFTVPARTEVERTFYGPCLVCGRDIKYGVSFRSTMSQTQVEDWLLKQFSEERRKVHLSQLEGRRQTGFLGTWAIEEITCEQCRKACAEARARTLAEKQARKDERARQQQEKDAQEYEERKQLAERWARHTEWRHATKPELAHLPDGGRLFSVTLGSRRPNKVAHRVLFRYRPVAGDCRGNSPPHVVGMWVDGKLKAHYYAWHLAPLDQERPYLSSDGKEPAEYDEWGQFVWPPSEDSRQEDFFALGFCRWAEVAFQPELLKLKPAALWQVRTCVDPLLSASSVADLPRPSVLHTRWIDGTTYATILAGRSLPRVQAFMEQNLRLRITGV